VLDVVALTTDLCSIESTTGIEAAVVDDLAGRLRKLGLGVARQNVGGIAGRDNLLATVDGRTPEVLLTTHIDCVPPWFPPTIVEEGGERWMKGRGVVDAKGIAAAMMCAMERFAQSGEARVGLLFVVGEETNSDGAKAAASGFAPKVKFFVDGEPTDSLLVRATKGVLAFELTVAGKAAHSAYPDAGRSAVHLLLDDLAKLRAEPWWNDPDLGMTTLNVGVIEGGVAQNVLAPHASAKLMMRTTSDVDVVVARIRALLGPHTKLDVWTKASPSRLHTVPGEKTCVVAFGSDVPHLQPIGRALLVGPGSILDAHTANERVKVADLQAAVDAYDRLARSLIQET
jgi:acetylornithine deacetylase